jgi:hypothetical protein
MAAQVNEAALIDAHNFWRHNLPCRAEGVQTPRRLTAHCSGGEKARRSVTAAYQEDRQERSLAGYGVGDWRCENVWKRRVSIE